MNKQKEYQEFVDHLASDLELPIPISVKLFKDPCGKFLSEAHAHTDHDIFYGQICMTDEDLGDRNYWLLAHMAVHFVVDDHLRKEFRDVMITTGWASPIEALHSEGKLSGEEIDPFWFDLGSYTPRSADWASDGYDHCIESEIS